MSGAVVGAVAGVMSIGSALGVFGGSSGGGYSQQAQYAVDPFAPYRAQYASQLNQAMQSPATAITNQPGYSFGLEQATQALQRQAASTGQLISGAEQAGLQQQTLGYEQSAYQQYLNNLMTMSGAGFSPAAGGQAGIQAGQYSSALQSGNLMGGLQALSKFSSLGATTQPNALNTSIDPGVSNVISGGQPMFSVPGVGYNTNIGG